MTETVSKTCLSQEEAASWLKKLGKKIAQPRKDGKTGKPFTTDTRSLTSEEFLKMAEVILLHEFPCTLNGNVYGFTFRVYGHSNIQGLHPEELLAISESQFPFPSANQGFAGQPATVKQLTQFTHNPRNTELLAWYGFEPLYPDAERYCY
jgi:hypothetical protein